MWQFSDALYSKSNQDLLMRLYAFLDKHPKEQKTKEEAAAADNSAKVVTALLSKGNETLEFLRAHSDIVSKLVQHIRNPNVLEYIGKLASPCDFRTDDTPLSDSVMVMPQETDIVNVCRPTNKKSDTSTFFEQGQPRCVNF